MSQLMNLYTEIKGSFEESKIDETNEKVEKFEKFEKFEKDKKLKGDICEKCIEKELDENDIHVICQNCGRVMRDIIVDTSEWRYYGVNDSKAKGDPSRCGGTINSLIPTISSSIKISGFGNEKYRKVSQWNNISYKDTSNCKIFNEIDRICGLLKIPNNISQKAKITSKMVIEKILKRGKIRQAIIGASIYYSCIDKKYPISQQQISDIIGINSTKMTHGCNLFRETMAILKPTYSDKIKPQTIKDFVETYCTKLDLRTNIKDKCIKLYEIADKLGILNDNTRENSAIGIIYYILMKNKDKIKINRTYIAKICDTTEVSVAKTYKILLNYEHIFEVLLKEN